MGLQPSNSSAPSLPRALPSPERREAPPDRVRLSDMSSLVWIAAAADRARQPEGLSEAKTFGLPALPRRKRKLRKAGGPRSSGRLFLTRLEATARRGGASGALASSARAAPGRDVAAEA